MLYNEKQIIALKGLLAENNLTIAVAESVTAGHLQAAISSAEEAGSFFHGGLTAYNLGQKARHLKINTIHAEKCNCVSKEVAIEMAFGVTDLFFSSIGVSITGYAAPLPEKGIKKIFAWFAVAKGNKLLGVFKISSKHTATTKVQIDYVDQVIKKTIQLLK